ncbi:MAG TPA: lysophospholipid acyltransferase family protein [Vicinamibacteria bacterium]|nr:lysophospholipid acyltransferase family protein [Vicinamibacteria bacterium]
MLRAFLIFVLVFPYTAVAAVVGLTWAALSGSVGLLFRLGHAGVRLALFLAGTKIALEGAHHLGDARNIVIMSNHESHLDAPVLFEGLGLDLRAVVKKEIFGWPFLGPVLRRAGFVAVDRRDRLQSARALSLAAERLRSGLCFLVFPEGTRSLTGELGPFKKGGFVAALEAGSRIVPVAVAGGRALMPRGGARVQAGTVRVRVLDPVEAGSYSYDQRERLAGEVHRRIAAALEDLRRDSGGGEPTAA